MATLYTEGFGGFVASTTAPVASGWSDQLPGGSCTHWEYAAFPRRTVTLGLHDPGPVEQTRYYLDASELGFLSFWVRAHAGQPRVRVELADREAADEGDSVPLGALSEYLTDGELTGAWQLVRIPFNSLPKNLDRSRLATLVLTAEPGTSGTIDIERPALCRAGQEPPPLTPHWGRSKIEPQAPSLWVWHTNDLAASEIEASRLAALIERVGIGVVYLQLPGELVRSQPDIDGAVEKLAMLTRRITAAGARVFALDGAPQYAQRRYHSAVLGAIANIHEYNTRAASESRFSGVHYDIEPYLLPEFGGDGRAELVNEYLALLDGLSAATGEADMELEVAIPFWFDGVPVIDADGGIRPLAELIIDRSDRVAIMDYRTHSEGSNGTVALAEHELVYASEVGKLVLVGLETTDLPDAELLHFYGRGLPGLPDGRTEHGWIVAGQQDEELMFVVLHSEHRADVEAALEQYDLDLDTVRHWEIKRTQALPSTRLTFADLGADAMHQVMRETAAALERVSGFGGFAIHYYEPYAEMLDAATATTAGQRP